jgi:hypothetical protein
MKKIALLALVLSATQSAYAVDPPVNADAAPLAFTSTTANPTYTVAASVGGLPSTRTAANFGCMMLGVNEPDVKVSASANVHALFRCDPAARGVGVVAQHKQGRPKACGPLKDQPCIFAGTTLGGKTLQVVGDATAGDAGAKLVDAANLVAAGTLTETAQ